MASDSVTIARRFNGPPDSGNGGYTCGVLARSIDGPAAVRLYAPPPLDTPLTVAVVDGHIDLRDGDTVVAQARSMETHLEVPDAPSFAEAEAAARRYCGYHDHVFPTCFVCGTERAEGDGLRIFPGPVEGRPIVASPWTPHPAFADETGNVRKEFVWAALDCPGAFAFPQPEGRAVVLGELAAHLFGPVRAGDPHIVIAWDLGQQGRKHWAGSAVFTADGECRAAAKATWIEVARPG